MSKRVRGKNEKESVLTCELVCHCEPNEFQYGRRVEGGVWGSGREHVITDWGEWDEERRGAISGVKLNS